MGRLDQTKIALLLLCGLCFAAPTVTVHGSCVRAYFEGGAPAVFQSPECTNWVQRVNSYKTHTRKCDLATLQEHRQYQEVRMTCNLDLKIPVFGRNGDEEAKLDVLALFDGHGHGGAEASEMANQKLLDYFILHVLFHIPKQAELTLDQHDLNPASLSMVLSIVTDFESSHNTLKEALLKAIHDIDMEFWSEAYEKRYCGGSTATVVLVLNDEEILVASLGNSPALLCKGSRWSRKLRAENLTRNHYPGEEDERARIEAAGGFVKVVGVPRVNGILPVSRAIGDIAFKRLGVIAEPEVKGWLKLTRKDRYLMIASDGIFQCLSPEGVCKIIEKGGTSESIVKAALKKGSMDKLSAIVLPLRQPTHSKSRSQPSIDEEL